MDLDQFISYGRQHGRANLYLREPGFKSLYVRYTRHWIRGVEYYPVLDLAVIEVRSPATGTLSRFLQRIATDYPELHVYVECVMNPKLASMLIRLGFEEVNSDPLDISSSFFLPARKI